MSTIVMRVDLDCDKCHKKIRKVLCKIQDKASIKTISYDEKSKTVTVSGPFDADDVADRLCSDAGKVITDIHVVGGKQMKPGKAGYGDHGGKQEKIKHGDGGGYGGYGGGKPEKIKHGDNGGYGGYGGGKPEKIKHGDDGGFGGYGGGKLEKIKHGDDGGFGGYGGGKPEKIKHGGHGDDGGFGGYGGGKPEKKHGGNGDHGGYGKPEKTKHVKFDMGDDGFDFDKHGHPATNGKPRVVNTMGMSRMEGPRAEPPVSMSAMAPMRMPAQAPMMMPQAMATPSIWPPAPEWGYSAPAYGGGLPAGGYYGGPPVYDHGGYAPPPPYGYGYGRNPYQQQQYYEEEPSGACSIM